MRFVKDQSLLKLDERFEPLLAANDQPEEDAEDEESGLIQAANAFLACRASEMWGYCQYIEAQSPFATQQGIKGAEFQRVLVVLDDEEGDYDLFSYGKYFGITDLSDRDQENITTGVDSVVSRTRRLFYVCCSRAVEDLAVVLFVHDVQAARTAIVARNFFSAENIYAL